MKKAEERAERERKEQEKALQDEKSASKVKCDACGGGILDCGFEKYGKIFLLVFTRKKCCADNHSLSVNADYVV